MFTPKLDVLISPLLWSCHPTPCHYLAMLSTYTPSFILQHLSQVWSHSYCAIPIPCAPSYNWQQPPICLLGCLQAVWGLTISCWFLHFIGIWQEMTKRSFLNEPQFLFENSSGECWDCLCQALPGLPLLRSHDVMLYNLTI